VWILFIFDPIKFTSDVVSSLFSHWCHLSSSRRRHTTASYHASFPWSQNEFAGSASSFGNASSCCIPSRAETKTLNSHHRRRPPSLDNPTHTLHFYKKVVSTLATLLTTQPHLYFVSSLARAPQYQSSACRHRFISPLSHAHHPSI
jgi:hypothetical protein